MSDDASLPQVAFAGRYLDVLWDGGTEYIRNRCARGVALVIPVTAAGEVVLIEQYRAPLRCLVIEYPAGLVGDEDPAESPEMAARRELFEESGYEAGDLRHVLRGPASPGSSTEIVEFYLARGVTQRRAGGGVGHERIQVHRVPLVEAEAWLTDRESSGVMVDPRVHLGLQLARRHLAAR